MRLRKLFLLMAAAVAVVAVVAVPASASAAQWLHEGKPITEHVEMKLTGGEVIEVNGGVLLCESHLTITTEGGTTGQASYEVTPASCVGLAGNLKECVTSEVKTTGAPWTVHVNEVDLTATGVKVDYTFAEGCPVKHIEVNVPELTLIPLEEPSSIRLFEWNTEGPGTVDGEPAEIGFFGSQSYPEAEFGTYGIG